MAVIKFSQAETLQSTVITNNWYPAKVAKVDGPKASSSQKSINWFYTFVITKGEFAGKEFDVAFNTGVKNHSMLNMQYEPHTVLLQVDAAINNKKIDIKDQEMDTDTHLYKELDIQVGTATVEGKLMNEITGFLPVGKGTQGSPF